VRRDQLQRLGRDAVVLAHLRRVGLHLASGREPAPDRHGPEEVVGDDAADDDDRRGRHARRQPLGAEDGRGDQDRNQSRRVVEADRGLRGRGREQVHRELWERCDEQEGRQHDEPGERQDQAGDVAEAAAGEGGREDLEWVGQRRVDDSPGRAADLAVAREEARGAGAVEVRDHDLDRDQRHRDSGDRDRRARPAPAVCERVPDPEAGDDERDLLLRGCGERRNEDERQQSAFVEEPDRVQQQRTGERNWVELVQRQPLRRRVDEVRERKAEPGARAAEVLVRQPVDGQRAEGDGDRLRDEQQVRARPGEPERGKRREDRVEVRAEPRELVAAEPGHL